MRQVLAQSLVEYGVVNSVVVEAQRFFYSFRVWVTDHPMVVWLSLGAILLLWMTAFRSRR